MQRLLAEARIARAASAELRFLDASATLEEWQRAIKSAESYVYIGACWFDSPGVTTELIKARRERKPKVECRLLFSFADRHQCANQRSRLQELRNAGVWIRGYSASRSHAK